jgi:hypothetical protein
VLRPDIAYGLSGHRVSIGICKAGPQAGWYVACFRYVTPKVPDWFMVEFGDGRGFTDPDAEIDFDDIGELGDYLDDISMSHGSPTMKRGMHYGKNFRRTRPIPDL